MGTTWVFLNLTPVPSNVFPPARTHFLIFPKQLHQLDSWRSSIQTHKTVVPFSFYSLIFSWWILASGLSLVTSVSHWKCLTLGCMITWCWNTAAPTECPSHNMFSFNSRNDIFGTPQCICNLHKESLLPCVGLMNFNMSSVRFLKTQSAAIFSHLTSCLHPNSGKHSLLRCRPCQ